MRHTVYHPQEKVAKQLGIIKLRVSDLLNSGSNLSIAESYWVGKALTEVYSKLDKIQGDIDPEAAIMTIDMRREDAPTETK